MVKTFRVCPRVVAELDQLARELACERRRPVTASDLLREAAEALLRAYGAGSPGGVRDAVDESRLGAP